MSESPENADARLAPLMEYFGERLNRVFAYFACTLEFAGDADLRADLTRNARAWSLQTIENACIDTTLIALRDLDDFLATRTPKTKPDDIRASDFGHTGSQTFLGESERVKINKLVAHTTTVGVASQGFRWDILELAATGISQGVTFLRWVEQEYPFPHFNLYTATIVIRKQTEARFAYISREAEKTKGHQSMSDAAETFESLWVYCTANGRAVPRDWHKLYEMLTNKRQKPSGGWTPSLPLILAAWDVTTPIEKQLRFKEHIEWARDRDQLEEIGRYLRSLPEDQWYHFGEL